MSTVVVVCGAGAAGMAAAIASARAGKRTLLIEQSDTIGGTVAHALIHTIGGLYDSACTVLNEGLPAELIERLTHAHASVAPRRLGRTWVLNVCPQIYLSVVQGWLHEQANLELKCRAKVTSIKQEADTLTEVEIEEGETRHQWAVQAIIDATGTAEIVRLVNPALLQDDPHRAAGGLILRIGNMVPGALAFPKGVALVQAIRAAATEGIVPHDCRNAWLDRGFFDDEAYLKLAVPIPDITSESLAIIRENAIQNGLAILDFLRQKLEFATARITHIGQLGIRDGGRIIGEYCLTREDVVAEQKFSDAACRCAWPVEFWDPEAGVTLEYLPDRSWYEIPYRSLRARGIANLWAVGKCLSADRYAQASARIAGCCWAMGDAVGKLC